MTPKNVLLAQKMLSLFVVGLVSSNRKGNPISDADKIMIDDTKAKRKADAKYKLYFDSKRSGNMLFRSIKVEMQTTNPMCKSGFISALKTNLPELGINSVITAENMELSINSGTI